MSLEFILIHSTCHVIAIIWNYARKRKLIVLECVTLEVMHFKCHNLRTEMDMPPLVLLDVAMSNLQMIPKNLIFVRCTNMTLRAWTVT